MTWTKPGYLPAASGWMYGKAPFGSGKQSLHWIFENHDFKILEQIQFIYFLYCTQNKFII